MKNLDFRDVITIKTSKKDYKNKWAGTNADFYRKKCQQLKSLKKRLKTICSKMMPK